MGRAVHSRAEYFEDEPGRKNTHSRRTVEYWRQFDHSRSAGDFGCHGNYPPMGLGYRQAYRGYNDDDDFC